MLLLFWIMSLLTRLYAEIDVELRAGETCFPSVLWLYRVSPSRCCSWCWGCTYCLQPGRKLLLHTTSLPCFLIHTDLTSNPASFYLLSNRTWWKHQTALTGGMYTNSWAKETKGAISKGMGKKWVSVHLSLCRLLLPEECISNHGACATLLPRSPERPKTWLYIG